MNDETYFWLLGAIKGCYEAALKKEDRPQETKWLETYGDTWHRDVAPKKHEQYGIECWERLGSRAVVADISACYYRHKRLMTLDPASWPRARMNVMLDSFGYAMIYTVCRTQELGPGFYDSHLIQAYETRFMSGLSAVELNEQIIQCLWDGQLDSQRSFPLVLSQAYAIYREQLATAS